MAQSHWQSACQNRIASLQNYWLSYYHFCRLTLYDYQRHQPIHYAKSIDSKTELLLFRLKPFYREVIIQE